MTDRLVTLLQREADALEIPDPPATAVLRDGRRIRTRHRLTVVAAAAAAVAVVGTTAAVLVQPEDRRAVPAVGLSPDRPTFAVGSTVYVDGASADVPDTVHSLHYTSLGALVRSNPNGGASDGSGPESLTLVRADGSTVDLGTVPEGVGPATDPLQPYYALAEQAGDGFEAVLREADTGEVVTRVPLPDLPKSYWDVPPLSLSGDTIYAGFKDSTVAVDWHTGRSRVVDGLAGGLPEIRGGRSTAGYGDRTRVVDVATGEVLLEATVDGYGWFDLSPDGRYALLAIEEGANGQTPTGVDVYTVATGTKVTLEGQSFGWGWTPDGHPMNVEGDRVTTCDPTTGACETATVDVDLQPTPAPVERSETTCNRNGENCVTELWTEGGEDPNRVVLGGKTYES